MANSEHVVLETVPIVMTSPLNVSSWRYLGERDAADLAYCVRFDVTKAPEPMVIQGGVWVYALPDVASVA